MGREVKQLVGESGRDEDEGEERDGSDGVE